MDGPIRDEWLPSPKSLESWFEEMRAELNKIPRRPLNSVIADFKNFALRNSEIYMQLSEMLDKAKLPKVYVLCTYVLTVFLSVDR